MEQISLSLAVSDLEEHLLFLFLKSSKRQSISNSEDQLIKGNYKIITSLFQQKSLSFSAIRETAQFQAAEKSVLLHQINFLNT